MATGLRWENIPESRVGSSSARDDAINIEVMNRGMDRFVDALNKFNTRKNDREVARLESLSQVNDKALSHINQARETRAKAGERELALRDLRITEDAEKALAVLESGAYNAGSNLKKKQTLGQFLHDSKMYQGLPKEVQGRVSKGLQDVWRQGNQDALTERNRAQELALRRESNALQRYQLNRQIAADKKAAEDAKRARGEHIADPLARAEWLRTTGNIQALKSELQGAEFKDMSIGEIAKEYGIDADRIKDYRGLLSDYNAERRSQNKNELPPEALKHMLASGKGPDMLWSHSGGENFLNALSDKYDVLANEEAYFINHLDPFVNQEGAKFTPGSGNISGNDADLEWFRNMNHAGNRNLPYTPDPFTVKMAADQAEAEARQRTMIEMDRLRGSSRYSAGKF